MIPTAIPARLYAEFVFLLGFLSRIPIPSRFWPRQPVSPASALTFAPLVGALLGGLAGGGGTLCALGMPPRAAAWGALALYALLGWSLHLDGWTDLADGWGSGKRGEALRKVMKDSRIGGYGAIFLVVALGLWTSLAEALPPGSWPLLLALGACAGRFALLGAAFFGTYPWETGLARDYVIPFGKVELFRGLLCAALLLPLGPRQWLVSMTAAFLAGWGLCRFARHLLGGTNGDVLGAAAVAGELAALAALVLGRS